MGVAQFALAATAGQRHDHARLGQIVGGELAGFGVVDAAVDTIDDERPALAHLVGEADLDDAADDRGGAVAPAKMAKSPAVGRGRGRASRAAW